MYRASVFLSIMLLTGVAYGGQFQELRKPMAKGNVSSLTGSR